MSLACKSVCAAVLVSAALGCAAPGTGPYATQERSADRFTSLVVSSGIQANVQTGNGTSVTVSGHGDLDLVESVVSPLGTLVLAVVRPPLAPPGPCASNIVVNVTVPTPLVYVAAAGDGHVTVDTLAGSMSAADRSSIHVTELATPGPVSIDASSVSGIVVSQGHVGSLTVSVSSRSSVGLGELTADSAVVTASSESGFAGMTVGTVTISVSSASSVTITATHTAAYSCSSASFLHISGTAAITEYASTDCRVETPSPAQAAVILP